MKNKRIEKFNDFYEFYLSEHSDKTNRTLHFIGTCLLLIVLLFALITSRYNLIWLCPLFGYSFAWIGHFVFEKNRPATFKQPVYSLISDFYMWWQLLTRKIYF